MKIDEEIDFDKISEITEGFSGADLKAVCTEAGMFAIRSSRKKVIAKDFLDAIDKIIDSSKITIFK
jgi:proteasome regulatory subunit